MATKKAPSIRVQVLAKELGVDWKAIVEKCKAEDIPDVNDYRSALSIGLAETIREWFGAGHSTVATAVETASKVDVEQARAKATKAKPKAKKSDDDDSDAAAPPITEADGAAEAAPIARPRPVRKNPAAKAPPNPKVDVSPTSIETTSPPEAPAPVHVPVEVMPAIAAKAPEAPSKPDSDGGAPAARPAKSAEPRQPRHAPVMNRPQRPSTVAPVGPMLQTPKKVEMRGPKLIRVEAPEVIAAPRPRTGGPMGRGGPRSGMGAGAAPPDAAGRGGDDRSSRRNKRRSNAPTRDEGSGGRSSRSAAAGPEGADRSFNWREQDLLERENRLNRAGGFFRAARRDNLKRTTPTGHRATSAAEAGGKVRVTEPITIKDLSAATGVKAADILRVLLLAGKPTTVNAMIDGATAQQVMLEHNIELDVVAAVTAEGEIEQQFEDREMVDERRRSPVVTILGHVDHGKTSMLDRIRNTNIAAGEAGGITQSTRAFQVPVKVGEGERMITFIDTPGHEAFTEMRARGAKVTDLVVLVVAADDGVMPQTVESINHSKAAGVPIVVALNKIDKPEATESNIRRIHGQLAEHELNPAEWGGQTEVIKVSALKNQGISDLLEMLDYQAQLLDLKADFGGPASGTVLEAHVAEGRGAVANVLVQQGQLKKGDFIVIGRGFGRVRDIVNDRGQRVESAGPCQPVTISGMDEVPDAGDKFYAVDSLKGAEAAALERRQQERAKDLAKEKITLDNIFQHLAGSSKKELPLVVKADVQGSVETLRSSLAKIAGDEVAVSIKHCAVGGVNESDVSLAEATGSIIVAFNVTASAPARKLADARGVDIRFYDVIYDLTDDVTKAAEGLLEPELKLEVLGHAEVREVFRISKVGMVAGCYVTDGVIERNSQIRVTRGGIVVEKDRRLEQLKRFKDDVKEVRAGQECGMKIDGYDDIKSGDVLECYKTKVVQRKL